MPMLGTDDCKIQLCDEDGVMQYEYTLEGVDVTKLPQPGFELVRDTKRVIETDLGYLIDQRRGHRFVMNIGVKYVDNENTTAWETFLYRLLNWNQKIRIIPHIDKPGNAYWVILMNSRDFETKIRNTAERGTLKFRGYEILSTLP
ncbi:MAG: hypothetical protein ABEK36_03995 [Candidatus Aenigmatarchaeota archaeon]